MYCHMFPRRLAAAREDFSLSELGKGQDAMRFWGPQSMGQCPPAQGDHPRGAQRDWGLSVGGERQEVNIWIPPPQAGAERGFLMGKGSCGDGGVSLWGDKGLEDGQEVTLSQSGDSQHHGLGRKTCDPLPLCWSRKGEESRTGAQV